MKTIHQQPTNLVLGVLTSGHLHNLTVLQAEGVNAGCWSFEFQIIGESHRIIVRRDNLVVLQEILACVPLVAADCHHFKRFTRLGVHSFRQDSYGVDIWFSEEPVPLLEGANLEVWFPAVYHQQPVTQIKWDVLPNGIRWWTLHLYPLQTGTITVLSSSHLQTKDGDLWT
ncbi:MAG: hypothetical protein L0154_05795 [Chloroflexi bacterium]|nr:hypothetical protein [Chloroflexota bacterium]